MNEKNIVKVETASQVEIYPMISDLVDCLYTPEINELIRNTCETEIDTRTFLMFIVMYFFVHFNLDSKVVDDKKTCIKRALSEVIADPERRHRCIKLFEDFRLGRQRLEIDLE